MKKLKATLFLICGLGTAMFLSSCLGDNNSDSYINLSKQVRSNYYSQITQGTYDYNYEGTLYRVYANNYEPADSLGNVSWKVDVGEESEDTTITITFPIDKLAKYIPNKSDSSIIANVSISPDLVFDFRAPYSESQDVYNSGYYRFICYTKQKSKALTSGGKTITINYSLADPGTTDENGDSAFFFSSNQPIVFYNKQYDQVIDILSITVGDKTYPLEDAPSGDKAAHFEIVYAIKNSNSLERY
ncbi:MAG: DUF4840 domain-containing protein [Prevotella sp.]|nr:DUF4840 domain-containing protein [Prevotella sp.]MCH3994474.1 DUF4840 domain-containing protein [Prevotella sp.]